MKEKIEISVTVLEKGGGTFEGKEYKNIIVRLGDKLLKFKVDPSVLLDEVEVDNTYVLALDIVKGQNLSATLKVVDIK